MPVGLESTSLRAHETEATNLCTERGRRQMSLLKASIANLPVTRKTLDAPNDEKLFASDS
jgi:hypothetical protein